MSRKRRQPRQGEDGKVRVRQQGCSCLAALPRVAVDYDIAHRGHSPSQRAVADVDRCGTGAGVIAVGRQSLDNADCCSIGVLVFDQDEGPVADAVDEMATNFPWGLHAGVGSRWWWLARTVLGVCCSAQQRVQETMRRRVERFETEPRCACKSVSCGQNLCDALGGDVASAADDCQAFVPNLGQRRLSRRPLAREWPQHTSRRKGPHHLSSPGPSTRATHRFQAYSLCGPVGMMRCSDMAPAGHC